MNGAYQHLLINHVPVIGIPFAFLLLAGGLIKKSRDLVQAGFIALVILAGVTFLADNTGDKAAGVVRSLPGIEREQVHEHAQAADWGVKCALGLGVLSIFGLWMSRESIPNAITIVAILGSLFSSVVMARVAHLGGLIRHPEIATSPVKSEAPE